MGKRFKFDLSDTTKRTKIKFPKLYDKKDISKCLNICTKEIEKQKDAIEPEIKKAIKDCQETIIYIIETKLREKLADITADYENKIFSLANAGWFDSEKELDTHLDLIKEYTDEAISDTRKEVEYIFNHF